MQYVLQNCKVLKYKTFKPLFTEFLTLGLTWELDNPLYEWFESTSPTNHPDSWVNLGVKILVNKSLKILDFAYKLRKTISLFLMFVIYPDCTICFLSTTWILNEILFYKINFLKMQHFIFSYILFKWRSETFTQ